MLYIKRLHAVIAWLIHGQATSPEEAVAEFSIAFNFSPTVHKIHNAAFPE